MTTADAKPVEQAGSAPETFGKLLEGEFLFDPTGVVHAPERQRIRALACPAFHDLAGEVEVSWRLQAQD